MAKGYWIARVMFLTWKPISNMFKQMPHHLQNSKLVFSCVAGNMKYLREQRVQEMSSSNSKAIRRRLIVITHPNTSPQKPCEPMLPSRIW